MRLARFERHAQRFAVAQQVGLADDIVEHSRAQALGQRAMGGGFNGAGPRGLGFITWFWRQKAVLQGVNCLRPQLEISQSLEL